MKKFVDGKYMDMTPEEIVVVEELRALPPVPAQKSDSERIAELEASNAELREALNLILEGKTA